MFYYYYYYYINADFFNSMIKKDLCNVQMKIIVD